MVKEITFQINGNLIVIRNMSFSFHFMLTLTLQKLLENTRSVLRQMQSREYFASANFTCVNGPMMQEV